MPPPNKRQKLIQNRKVLITVAAVVLIGVVALFLSFTFHTTELPEHSSKSSVSSTSQSQTLRIIATGDTIAHDALNAAAKKADGSYDYYQFMKPLKQYFDKADIRFCNQAVPGGGTEFGIRGYPVFNSPLEVARDLDKMGCNVINTGTNHTFDNGQPVIDAELNYWDKLPNVLAVAGANRSPEEQHKLRLFSVKGVKFAFLSYSTYSNSKPLNSYGLNVYNAETAKREITEARQKADIVLVSMRWGTEYSPNVNAEQERVAQQLADAGADIVWGHGPHVLEPVRQLTGSNNHKTYVWYSIGNFLNAQENIESLVSGLAITDINLKTKQVEAPKYLPVYMHYEWTAEEKAHEDLLKRHNFTIVPLDQAATLLARSQNNTTVAAQTARVQAALGGQQAVTLVTSKTY